jgi:hypothetical protein
VGRDIRYTQKILPPYSNARTHNYVRQYYRLSRILRPIHRSATHYSLSAMEAQ